MSRADERPAGPMSRADERPAGPTNRADEATRRAGRQPFATHPLRRYAFAWSALAGRTGRHLDLGCGPGDFLAALHEHGTVTCEGADPHPGYLAGLAARHPDLPLHRLRVGRPLPFTDGRFDSVSLLDVLEHVPDEAALLAETRRVLVPGGLLVLTVPRRHVFSFLDPDNAKFDFPRLHRRVYSWRFGSQVWHSRFADLSNDLRGDMSVGRDRHTNYRTADLLDLLRAAGFAPTTVTGANLFWRWLQIPALLTGGPVRRLLERGIHLDGRLFRAANLFVVARRQP
ncbi:class I SAM-dependent methyltransferase [Micromonospora sp. DT227]|uniref:class I SAM-dependent methyltransferase n=1 Tax=Micromonospora sp. DT227 TaxID=3393433 RepID=UPI003CE6D4D1